jgi:hypothetical protein
VTTPEKTIIASFETGVIQESEHSFGENKI